MESGSSPSPKRAKLEDSSPKKASTAKVGPVFRKGGKGKPKGKGKDGEKVLDKRTEVS